MTANNFSASGRVLFQSGDDLDEGNLSEILAKGNQTNYVERGLSVSLDAAAGTVDIGTGHAVIEDNNAAFDLFPPSASGLPVPNNNGNNYVFLEHDPSTQDEIQYHIDDNDTAPGNPSLKIAVVDMNANSVTELNRAPDIQVAEAAIDRLGQNLNGQGFDLTNLGTVDTKEVDITDETFIRATRGSTSSSTTSGTFINPFNGESADNRNEFNSNQKFSPDESGEYELTLSIDFRGSTSTGDVVQIRVEDSNNNVVSPTIEDGARGSAHFLSGSMVLELSSGNTYEILATNQNSSFKIDTVNTEGVIRRSVVHG